MFNHSIIRRAVEQDIACLTKLMLDNLKGSLPEKLGYKFVKGYFIPALIRADGVLVLVEEIEGGLKAFAVFSVPEIAILNLMRGAIGRIFIHSIFKIFHHPFLLADLFFSGVLNRTVVHDQSIRDTSQLNYLLYLAVSKECQGRGVGGAFLKGCFSKKEFPQLKSRCIVETGDERVKSFYLKFGFHVIGYRRRFLKKLTLFALEVVE